MKIDRNLIAQRAGFRCEYCRVHEDDSFLTFHLEHIAAKKHGGGDEPENLAYACPHCNSNKGTDLTTFLTNYDDIVQLFNPRKHDWFDHFESKLGKIYPKSRTGEATIKLLQLNAPDQIIRRAFLEEAGRFP